MKHNNNNKNGNKNPNNNKNCNNNPNAKDGARGDAGTRRKPRGGKPGGNGKLDPNEGFIPDPKVQDPYWYAKDDAAIKSFGNLPFVSVNGAPLKNISSDAATTIRENVGIVIVPFVPTIPGAKTDHFETTDFTTKAASAYFQYVTQGFTGSVDFEAADLLMTALAAESLMTTMCAGARAFGCMNYYLQSNAYWAKRVVTALGFDFESLRANRMEFVAQYNLLVEQINKTIAVPRKFFIGDRWRYLATSVFSEGTDDAYDAIVAYIPTKVMEYDGVSLETGTCLAYEQPPFSPNVAPCTVSAFFAFCYRLLSELQGDDPRTMFGAIRRVYSDGDLLKATPITIDYLTAVTNNSVQCAQLHNSNTFAEAQGEYYNDLDEEIALKQDAMGNIIANYYGRMNAGFDGNVGIVDMSERLLSTYGVNTEPGTVLDITANMVAFCDENETVDSYVSDAALIPLYPRTEILLHPRVFSMEEWGEYDTLIVVEADGSYAVAFNRAVWLSRIPWLPFLYLGTSESGVSHVDAEKPSAMCGELGRYTFITNSFIADLHAKTAFNLLCLPENSKEVTR